MPNTLRALEVLLEPQERLDRLIGATFRRLGPRLVDLSYANPSEGPSAEVLDVLKRVTVERSGLSLSLPFETTSALPSFLRHDASSSRRPHCFMILVTSAFR
jgi:hypothetical protein